MCPYRGLMAFRPDDGDLFFGREEVVASILDRVLDGGFMAVVGASGSGKSSLVRAGLVPAYHRAREGEVVVMTPGSDPIAELERSLSVGSPSLLVVDQLEEVFTLCPDEASRGRLHRCPAGLARGGPCVGRRRPPSRLLRTMRRASSPRGRSGGTPTPAGAYADRRASPGDRKSRSHGGLRLQDGLVDAMLADVEGEPGALPLLSHALYESWARRDGRVLTLAGYRAAGGVRGAIAHTAEEVFLGCSRQEQLLMRRMFLLLTELGETTEDTRRPVPLAELVPEGESGVEATEVLEGLTASRLLVVGDDSAEIAHEALIREWPRLRSDGWPRIGRSFACFGS